MKSLPALLLKPLAVVGLCLMSTACIAVGSREPMFSTTDAGSGPQPRPGLWASPDPGCSVDESAPTATWPSCANGTVVRALAVGPPGDPDHLMPFVLTGGDPRIVQLPWPGPARKNGPKFSYVGLRPTKFDDQGRFIEAKVWIALCGEQAPPPKTLAGEKTAPPNDFKPTEGLDWHKGDDFCLADSKDRVRAAAKASEAWTGDPSTIHWVRDTEN